MEGDYLLSFLSTKKQTLYRKKSNNAHSTSMRGERMYFFDDEDEW